MNTGDNDQYHNHCPATEQTTSSNPCRSRIRMITSRYIEMQHKQLKIVALPTYLLTTLIVAFINELPAITAHFCTGINDLNNNNKQLVVPYLDTVSEYFSKLYICTWKGYLLMTYPGIRNKTWSCYCCGQLNKFVRRLCGSCSNKNLHTYYPAYRWTLKIASITINGCIKITINGFNEFNEISDSEFYTFGILIYKKTIFTTTDEKDSTGCLLTKSRCSKVKIDTGDVILVGISNDKLMIILRDSKNNNNIKTTFTWEIPTIKYRLYVYTSNSQNVIHMVNFSQIG